MRYHYVLKITSAFIALCFLSSCVAMYNTGTIDPVIKGGPGLSLVYDSTRYLDVSDNVSRTEKASGLCTVPAEGLAVSVPRSKEPLILKVKDDSTEKLTFIPAQHSSVYYCNLLNYGIGFIFDHKDPNRFTYPKTIYLDYQNNTWHRYPLHHTGDISLNLSIPYANSFLVNDGLGTNTRTGFWGITLGANYWYSEARFISAQAGWALNYFMPIPVAVERFGDTLTDKSIRTLFVNVKDNFVLGRFDIGYGLSAMQNIWDFSRSVRTTTRDYTKTSQYSYNDIALGTAFSCYYRLGRTIHLGLLYQPTFLCMHDNSTQFKYGHLISLDVSWRFNLR